MHAPMWTLKHQVLWSCDTRAQDSFFLLKSTQCFQNMFLYQFMHSSESILGVQKKFTAFALQVYTHFSQKSARVLNGEILASSFLEKRVGFLVDQNFYLYHFFVDFFYSIASRKDQRQSANRVQLVSATTCYGKQGVQLKVHKTYIFIVSYKTSQRKYDNARRITESDNGVFSLDIATDSNNVNN